MILTSLSRHIAHLLDHQTLARVGGGAAEFSACYKCGGGSRADKTCCDNPDDATCCKGKCKTVHNYYQWVAYILVLQVTLALDENENADLVAFVGGPFPSTPPAVVNHGRGASERYGQRNQ